ncbi:hypothetical protein SORBI_3001G307450 [Sorghum bicolor]|uniref:Uncharacterized protein n=1 Tax=Sorghum bicolor TaxID=4558 RepID=A0A1Z5S8D3_SORBI|nr:hypothetical protein SORBI_3001G307450 [Sorghum bicolor]
MSNNVLSQSEPQKAGCSSTTSPLIGSSGTKRKRPVVNQHKSLATKQFKPPMAKKLNSPVMMRSPMMRLLVSPLVVRPRSLALGLQPSRSPWRSPSCSPRRSPSRGPWAWPAHTPPSGATHPGSHGHGNYLIHIYTGGCRKSTTCVNGIYTRDFYRKPSV